MNYAIVENGVIVNTIVSEAEYAESIGAIAYDGNYQPGDRYENGIFIKANPQTTPEPTIEERTTALEATQSDVIDVLASALGVTI